MTAPSNMATPFSLQSVAADETGGESDGSTATSTETPSPEAEVESALAPPPPTDAEESGRNEESSRTLRMPAFHFLSGSSAPSLEFMVLRALLSHRDRSSSSSPPSSTTASSSSSSSSSSSRPSATSSSSLSSSALAHSLSSRSIAPPLSTLDVVGVGRRRFVVVARNSGTAPEDTPSQAEEDTPQAVYSAIPDTAWTDVVEYRRCAGHDQCRVCFTLFPEVTVVAADCEHSLCRVCAARLERPQCPTCKAALPQEVGARVRVSQRASRQVGGELTLRCAYHRRARPSPSDTKELVPSAKGVDGHTETKEPTSSVQGVGGGSAHTETKELASSVAPPPKEGGAEEEEEKKEEEEGDDEYGCPEQQLLFKHWLEHRQHRCKWRPVLCADCGARVQARALARHRTASCPRRSVPCAACGDATVRFDEAEQHRRDKCPAAAVTCPNAPCDVYRGPRSGLAAHRASCAHEPVPCVLQRRGCAEVLPRQSLHAHLLDGLVAHLLLLANDEPLAASRKRAHPGGATAGGAETSERPTARAREDTWPIVSLVTTLGTSCILTLQASSRQRWDCLARIATSAERDARLMPSMLVADRNGGWYTARFICRGIVRFHGYTRVHDEPVDLYGGRVWPLFETPDTEAHFYRSLAPQTAVDYRRMNSGEGWSSAVITAVHDTHVELDDLHIPRGQMVCCIVPHLSASKLDVYSPSRHFSRALELLGS